ncbi:MAG: hypothetical protein MJ198_02500 [Bacteroidales bacterium]|nr:hypothetical protein [Bacteroidales bacterium]
MSKLGRFIIVICIGLFIVSCNKSFYANTSADKLTFSADTVSFDTVFTEKGSITKCVKIKNNCNGIIKIDRIYLENDSKSEFYINVNGSKGPRLENIDIDAGDSIFVFVQTNLQNQKVDTLLYHEEILKIEYNHLSDQIILTAWGQDVINLKGAVINTQTFTANKPYVIYDSLVVNEGEILTIEAGAKIYFHYNANLLIRGTLQIKGTSEYPVTMSSDRLEQTYQLLPGQWGSIIFESKSRNNEISYALIKNGVNGLVFYGDNSNKIDCNINNSQISNMSGNGIYALNAHIDSYNCVFINCDYTILNIMGGWFNSVHNTIYNEGSTKGRKYYPSVSISDYKMDSSLILVEKAHFYNSIVVGTMTNEISFVAENGDNSLPCLFKNCLLRDTYTRSDSAYYLENTFYDKEKTLFSSQGVYTLDTLSQAINIGKLEFAELYPTDLLNHSRIDDEKPDVGAMEYYYEPKK